MYWYENLVPETVAEIEHIDDFDLLLDKETEECKGTIKGHVEIFQGMLAYLKK